jgi:hypothetical protein
MRRGDGSVVSIKANVDGKKAEAAFYQECSTILVNPPDFSITASNDAGVDFRLKSDGRTIDVKMMGRYGFRFNPLRKPYNASLPPLEALAKSGFHADIGVMCWPAASQDVWLVGWVTRERFLSVMSAEDFGYGSRRTCDWEDMLPIRELGRSGAMGGVREWLCVCCQDRYRSRGGGDYCVFCAGLAAKRA